MPSRDEASRAVVAAARGLRLAGGQEQRVLFVDEEARIASETGADLREVQLAALSREIVPTRYLRNFKALGFAEQARLLGSSAAMVGLGGLGGHLLEAMARMGVGSIRAADGDVFEEHNLNRQLLSSGIWVGRAKAEAAVERVAAVNPSVSLRAEVRFVRDEEMREFVDGADIAVDALGGLGGRLALQRAAADAGIPLVTGAMAGLTGYVAVVRPGEPGPAEFLGQGGAAEDTLGTPAPSVAVIASLMSAEIMRLLSGGSSPLVGGMLLVDLAEMRFERVSLTGG